MTEGGGATPLPHALGETLSSGSGGDGQLVFSYAEASWSAPLPPPSVLKAYQTLDPTLLDRIVTMAEKEQSARHASQVRSDDLADLQQRDFSVGVARGQWLAILVVLIFVGFALACLVAGQTLAAVAAVVLTVAGAMGVVWRGKSEPLGSRD